MKLYDVVSQVRIVLPKYTNKFSNIISIDNIDVTNNIGIITTTSAHNLTTGSEITLQGYSVKNYITAVSQDGLQFTFTTNTNHDLSENWQETITIGNFTDDDWNETFDLGSVPNRKNFKIRSTNTIPVLNGTEYLLENKYTGINGQHSVTVIDSTHLQISGNFDDGNYIGGTLSSYVRIVGSVNLERFLNEYTEQTINNYWICITMNDVDVSKDRNTYSDAILNATNGSEIRLQLLDGFTIYIIIDVTKDITANDAIDFCRHTLLLPILKSVYGVIFPTGLTGLGDFRTVFTGHKTEFYDKAIYIHRYDFQMPMNITEDDTVDRTDTTAYRDTNFSLNAGDSTSLMTVIIDHDDEPLDRG